MRCRTKIQHEIEIKGSHSRGCWPGTQNINCVLRLFGPCNVPYPILDTWTQKKKELRKPSASTCNLIPLFYLALPPIIYFNFNFNLMFLKCDTIKNKYKIYYFNILLNKIISENNFYHTLV